MRLSNRLRVSTQAPPSAATVDRNPTLGLPISCTAGGHADACPHGSQLKNRPPSLINQAAPRSGSSHRKTLLRPSIKQPPTPSLNRAAPRSGSSPRKSLLRPSIEQPRAAAAPPEAAPYSIPQKQPPPSLNQAAPRSGSFPRSSPLHPSIKQPRAAGAPQKQPPTPSPNQAAPRSGSSSRSSLLRPSIKQPRAAAAPPEAASSVPQSSSPAQRQLPQKEPVTIAVSLAQP